MAAATGIATSRVADLDAESSNALLFWEWLAIVGLVVLVMTALLVIFAMRDTE